MLFTMPVFGQVTSSNSTNVFRINPENLDLVHEVEPEQLMINTIIPFDCHEIELTYLAVEIDANTTDGGTLVLGLYEGDQLLHSTSPIVIPGGQDVVVGEAVPPGIVLNSGIEYKLGVLCESPNPIYIKASSHPSYVSFLSAYAPVTTTNDSPDFPNLPDFPFGSNTINYNLAFQAEGVLSSGNTYASITETACGQYTSPSGNAVWTSSGIYSDVLPNSNGCDSIVTVELTINNLDEVTTNVTECGAYFWPVTGQTYTTSGVYSATFVNSNGCDSILNLNLSIESLNPTIIVYEDSLVCSVPNATYQWYEDINGLVPIVGATQQHYIATMNGVYVVEASSVACSEMSSNAVIENADIESVEYNSFQVYPNPSSGQFKLIFDEAPEHVEVLDLTGRVMNVTLDESKSTIDASELASGKYIVRVFTGNNQSAVEQIIIQ